MIDYLPITAAICTNTTDYPLLMQSLQVLGYGTVGYSQHSRKFMYCHVRIVPHFANYLVACFL